MNQQSPLAKRESTWGKFSTQQAAEATQIKLKEADIAPEKITLETEDFQPPVKLEDTGAIANLKSGAIRRSLALRDRRWSIRIFGWFINQFNCD